MSKQLAERWYEHHSVGDDIVRFTESHVDPYAVGDIWLLRGSRTDLVIDTGSGILSPRPAISLVSDKPLLAVALNSHYDHAGGWHFFDERACHPLDAPALRDPSWENDHYSDYLSDESLDALPWSGYSTTTYRMTGAEPTQLLTEGAIVDMGNRQLDVLHIPGRSPGGLALWEAATGNLFTSDMLYDGPHGLAWPPSNPKAYRASLLRMRALPVTRVYPGHYGEFDGNRMRTVIDEQLTSLEPRS